jgi:hypothetical protein
VLGGVAGCHPPTHVDARIAHPSVAKLIGCRFTPDVLRHTGGYAENQG